MIKFAMALFVTPLWRLGVLIPLVGCALSNDTPRPVPAASWNPQSLTSAAVAPAHVNIPAALPVAASPVEKEADVAKLTQLWNQRRQQKTGADYPVGPGDVLEVSVPAMEELQRRVVRVAGDGTIALPFVGVLPVSGLTERQLREELWRRLQKEYMHDPQVAVFVREYRSRQVAVLGAVKKPGLYSLASDTDTLLDMISLAGGLKEDAAPRILFNPAESEQRSVQGLSPPTGDSSTNSSLSLNPEPLVIELNSTETASRQMALSLPARPGDVITVPSSGETFVAGWVAKPGAYKVTPGLTVLGAVAAAGGPLFAAKTSDVKIIRMGKDGQETHLSANLDQIESGESVDTLIQGGDVIAVSASGVKLVPYSFYSFVTSILHIGASATVY